MHRAADLETLFRDTFYARHHTVLEGGFAEPLYRPGAPARIRYTHDYFRSALHEVAHWCVAGRRRRALEDYGYWYAPDGRDADQQARFLRVEVRPQAFEALFCAACDHRFQVSLDNLDGDPGDAHRFATDVRALAHDLIDQGLPERPRQWVAALERHYHTAHRPLADRLDAVFPPTDRATLHRD
ncbi:Elongation factor P hydroxylase [Alcanivorax sp. ALC70]|nr:Elongation factor P hydroxylase [Alcanivorax sp. ALC70]